MTVLVPVLRTLRTSSVDLLPHYILTSSLSHNFTPVVRHWVLNCETISRFPVKITIWSHHQSSNPFHYGR